MVTWSDVQIRRLRELGAPLSEQQTSFDNIEVRDAEYQRIEKSLVTLRRIHIRGLQAQDSRSRIFGLTDKLIESLQSHGFTQVVTPTLMSRALLEKMSIHEKHPLNKQIFWVDKKHCLRPMLAPHLYSLLRDLTRLWEKPIRIFEIGSCFRKETRGSQHSAEFTMLNLVELGLPRQRCLERIEQLAALVLEAANVNDFWLERQQSAVYGHTVDILSRSPRNGKEKIELGSGATGPHALDRNWQITEPWAGIGFGIERLMMVAHNSDSLGQWGRSLRYIDGVSLRI